MTYTLTFHQEYAGRKCIAVNSQGAEYVTDPRIIGNGTFYRAKENEYVILSGFVINKSGYEYFQIDSTNLWIIASQSWALGGYGQKPQGVKAQDIINGLINNNKIILENNLLMSRYYDRLTDRERKAVYMLQTRLIARDELLREGSGLAEGMMEGTPPGYDIYVANLQMIMNNKQGVGVVLSSTAVIIISFVVAASLATAGYFAFRAAYAESVEDVKLSNEMLKVFAKYNMSDQDIALIEQETKGLVTRARLLEKIKGVGSALKNILLLAAGGALLWWLMKYKGGKTDE